MKAVTALAVSILLSGCATTQLTSGADYLARADAVPVNSYVDADVRTIAAIEPDLRFPARIGVAYLDKGRLSAIPADHLEAWQPVIDTVQDSLGEIVPISPLIAQMVAAPSTDNPVADAVDHVRRGAARQHVDYVLVYETAQAGRTKGNALRVADLTIIGLFVLPTRGVEVEASASAVLLDVRNGYPYGTASGMATKDRIATVAGSGDARRGLQDKAELAAMHDLSADVGEMLDRLAAQTALMASAEP